MMNKMSFKDTTLAFDVLLKKSTGKPRQRYKIILACLALLLGIILIAISVIFLGEDLVQSEQFGLVDYATLVNITLKNDKLLVFLGGVNDINSMEQIRDIEIFGNDSCSGLPR